ncbi:DNA fragmentation factor-related protein 2 isoform X1 [Leptinotarsa decemlineata]|uniref:DNA fragmentation factor-related protein 2 isoform X1 n=1 Tax=Leptinotarsa decemlineata TaxID=7539 RepID=UPI003D30C4FE
MAREESRGKRPFKLWDGRRNVRKGLVVGSLEELVQRGRDKLGVSIGEPVRLVLESDGTQVEDGEYFRTLPANTILLLLRPGERWLPAGVDVIKAVAISAIPKIVCETIHALELHDETPSWKIMDNKGRVTVVLHWDQRSGPSRAPSETPSPAPGKFSPSKRPPLVIQTGTGGKKETIINDVYVPAPAQPQPRYASPQITVINHDDIKPVHRLSKQGSSLESATIHIHTSECAHHAHMPRAGSPQSNGAIECDFHCCALHEEGRKIAVHKSVATSPIQDTQQTSPQPPSRHVRFLDIEGDGYGGQSEHESSESETENTVMEDEAVTSEKFLLLIDQLSVDQKRHLSIRDIGVILDRLSSKILDVERLDRESESDDCFNWTIKATIRGDIMRDLGVIYNGNYYAISEHPGYKEENEGVMEEAEEEEEEEDRL